MPPERVKLVICDVDGVLTDGVIGLNERGEEHKNFSVLDGMGVSLLQEAGIRVAFLSSRASAVVEHRARELRVDRAMCGVRDKGAGLDEILAAEKVPPEEVCYVGDDLLDLPCLRRVGFPVAVSNARDEVKQQAEYTTRTRGGHGAVREVAETVLRARGLWESLLENYR